MDIPKTLFGGTHMIDILWILSAVCFATSLISASIAEGAWLYRKQRMWENIACVLMAFVFIFGGIAKAKHSNVLNIKSL